MKRNPLRFCLSAIRRTLMIFTALVVFAILALLHLVIWNPARRIAAAKAVCKAGEKLGCRILGITIREHGSLPDGGVLMTPNHTSYAEVLALGSRSSCLFVPKEAIGRWPVVGLIVRMTGYILVKRKAGRAMRVTAMKIRERLEQGHKVCVFLEGTTTGGDRMLPFRASFLQPAIEAGTPVVPVALKWTATRPGTSVIDDLAFWDSQRHHFWPHLARLAGLGGFELDIHYLAPISTEGKDRKSLARETQAAILEKLNLEIEAGEIPEDK